MSRDATPLLLDDRGFEGTQVLSLEDAKPRSWIEAVVNYLRPHRPSDAIGILTLGVLPAECYLVHDSWAQVTVTSLTVVFAVFVVLIGRSHGDRIEASGPADPGAAREGPGETGEPQRGDGPEPL